MAVGGVTSETGNSGGLNQLSNADDQKQMFLTLLVTQLQNQDPINPVSNEDFLGQMAQFTSLEQMTNMVATMENLVSDSGFSKSVGLIGRDIDYINLEDGVVYSGTVEAVATADGESELVLGDGTRVGVDQVVRVQ